MTKHGLGEEPLELQILRLRIKQMEKELQALTGEEPSKVEEEELYRQIVGNTIETCPYIKHSELSLTDRLICYADLWANVKWYEVDGKRVYFKKYSEAEAFASARGFAGIFTKFRSSKDEHKSI